MNKETIKIFVQGAVVGAIALSIGIFWSGIAVTAGKADSMAQDKAEAAVVEYLTPICVSQFSQTDNTQQFRKDLEAAESWKRADFVKTNGWATMPGSDAPRNDVARACAEMILKPGA